MGVAVIWMRNILRVHDNPLLTWASSREDLDTIIPIFIMNPERGFGGTKPLGSARMRFLHDSLIDLSDRLTTDYSAGLTVLSGRPVDLIPMIAEILSDRLEWLLCDYVQDPRSRDEVNSIQCSLSDEGVNMRTFSSVNTLLDVEAITQSDDFVNPKSSKDMAEIFNRSLGKTTKGYLVPKPLDPPESIDYCHNVVSDLNGSELLRDSIVSRHYLSTYPDRISAERCYFPGGESEAIHRLMSKVIERPEFVNQFNKPSTTSTNEPSNPLEPTTTGLSPYLSTGCLSIRLLWEECRKANEGKNHTDPPQSLQGQLMFREMFYLLSRSVENWDDDVDNSNCRTISWGDYDEQMLTSWETGMTGFPYIDAMMRQLDATGWMHHLGRHAVSCFLTRGQLWQNWKHGRDVFERKLVDSDWAVNNGNWLWLAGVAPFSMPYYRVYNPCPDSKSSLNVETKEAEFIRHWIPELASFPSKFIFEPHLAPIEVQNTSGCIIGKDYPLPIVDRKKSRASNLASFRESLDRES